MNYRLFWLVVLTALWGCGNDDFLEVRDSRDIEVPEGFVLSAGTSTIFKNSSYAYDTEADWVARSVPGPFQVRFKSVPYNRR